MTYEDYINELKSLLERARALFDVNGLQDNRDFKRWKKELSTLVLNIEEQGYDAACSVMGRSFTLFVGYGSIPSEARFKKQYNDDLQDTIDEMEIIIENYGKYGEPKGTSAIQPDSSGDINFPKIITIVWLFRHLPIYMWIAGILILVSVFSIGIKFGNTEFYESLKSASDDSSLIEGEK